MSDLQTEIISTPAAMAGLEPEWNRLWLAQARREVFTGFHWAAASWQAFGAGQELRVIVVKSGGRVIGILPLMTGSQDTEFLGGHHADYNDILVAADDPNATVIAALETAGNTGDVLLENLPEWSTLVGTLETLPARLRGRIGIAPGPPCPALRLDHDREALLADMTSKQSLKRHEKKLGKLGPVMLRHLEDRGAIRERMPDFFAQHVARRALAGERSLFLDEHSRTFYQQLIARLDPAAELRFAVLEAGERVVAYHFGFEVAGRFTWYKPSFDIDYYDAGPGEVLLKRLLEYVRERPVREFDFTRGAESFKDRFSNHAGDNVTWTLHRSASAAGLAGLRRRAVTELSDGGGWGAIGRGLLPLARGMRELARGGSGTPEGARSQAANDEWIASSVQAASALTASAPMGKTNLVRRASLRELATYSVSGNALFSPADMRDARARIAAGQIAHVALAGDRPVALAWSATVSELRVPWTAEDPCRVPLEAPAFMIELAVCESANAATALVTDVARDAGQLQLWLLHPASDSPCSGAATPLGFERRYRLTWRKSGEGNPAAVTVMPETSSAD